MSKKIIELCYVLFLIEVLQNIKRPAETTINEPMKTGNSNISLKKVIPIKVTKTNCR